MKKMIIQYALAIIAFVSVSLAYAAPNLEINTPAINAVKSSMQSRHNALAPHYESGAVGLTSNGFITVRDAKALPLKDRQGINALVSEENSDRKKLYKEIAVANGHPEWESSIQESFAGRWIDKAKSGWYYQNSSGWQQK
ncbi:MAG: YdbL family protein [Methylophilaceae bacterium]